MDSAELYVVHDREGRPLDSHFGVEEIDGFLTVVLESRGGKIGSSNQRNKDYSDGLDLILERLAFCGAVLEDAVVDTARTRQDGLSLEQRRLKLAHYDYPQKLSLLIGLTALRKELCAAQLTVGRKPGSTGGNITKRVRLFLSSLPPETTPKALAGSISRPQAYASAPESDLESVVEEASVKGQFDPESLEDSRKKIMSAIVQRQGQPQFRQQLLQAYGSHCAITDCDLPEALEAAHIIGYLGEDTNTVQNGILLRSDVHTLFDRGLIAIDTQNWTLLIADKLQETVYRSLYGKQVNLPRVKENCPDVSAINLHRQAAGL